MYSEKLKNIKKALDICKRANLETCRECPYNYTQTKTKSLCHKMAEHALTLINELESENDTLHTNLCEYRKENQQLKDRIAELEKENERLDKVVKHFQELIEDGKLISSEQLKQFAERLKEKLEEYRLKNEYFTEHEPNSNLWQMNSSVFCIEVTQDGGLVDETLKEFINK